MHFFSSKSLVAANVECCPTKNSLEILRHCAAAAAHSLCKFLEEQDTDMM